MFNGGSPLISSTLRDRCGWRRQSGQSNIQTFVAQQPGGNIAIAAIIARATQHQNRLSATKAPDSIGKRLARTRHEIIYAYARCHAGRFRCAHFGSGQHRSRQRGQSDIRIDMTFSLRTRVRHRALIGRAHILRIAPQSA